MSDGHGLGVGHVCDMTCYDTPPHDPYGDIELERLCGAAEDRRQCDEAHSMIRQGCEDCERHQAQGASQAGRTLERRGYTEVKAARRYIALVRALTYYANEERHGTAAAYAQNTLSNLARGED